MLIMFGLLGNFNFGKIISNLLCLLPHNQLAVKYTDPYCLVIVKRYHHAFCPGEFTYSAAPNPKGAGCSVQRDVTHTGLISSY